MEANKTGVILLVATAILVNFLWVAATQINAKKIVSAGKIQLLAGDKNSQKSWNGATRLAKQTRDITIEGEKSAPSFHRQKKRDSNRTPALRSEKECQRRALVAFMIYRYVGLAKSSENQP